MNNKLEKVVIVGGGTAGWLAAAALSQFYKNTQTQITLVESAEIGTIGVGEATIPPILNMLESCGINLSDFMAHTDASFKLGIEFDGWKSQNERYFHPFGKFGQSIDGAEFYQAWLKAGFEGNWTDIESYSLESVLAKKDHFFVPTSNPNDHINRTSFALHLDAGLAVDYLRAFATAQGVQHIEGTVVDVMQCQETQFIQGIKLSCGKEIVGDFFFDCSGFKSLLLGETLGSEYDDWSDYLPCDSAIAVQTRRDHSKPLRPYTISKAQEAGWSWHIPLQTRTGNGYVFSSKFMDDEKAKEILLSTVEGEPITEPRLIRFKTGTRKQPWKHNCIALGLAQGFIEPLESTAIHLVVESLAMFAKLNPSKHCESSLQAAFNEKMVDQYVQIRDFLVAHYCYTQRDDSAFWIWCQNEMPKPPTLKKREQLFKELGSVLVASEELFQPTSWYAVLTGMGVKPSRYNGTIDSIPSAKINEFLAGGSAYFEQLASKQPSHADVVQTHCRSVLLNNDQ